MNSRFRMIGFVLMLAFSLIAATNTQANTPKDVLVVGQVAEPKSLDPATVTAVNDFRILMNIYDGLGSL